MEYVHTREAIENLIETLLQDQKGVRTGGNVERRLLLTSVPPYWVSTYRLGPDDDPFWETLVTVFPPSDEHHFCTFGPIGEDREQYPTLEEALVGHLLHVTRRTLAVVNGQDPWPEPPAED